MSKPTSIIQNIEGEQGFMKAAVCYEFGQPLVIEDIEIDNPNQNEVKVKVLACAICHSDIIYIDGGWGGTLPAVYGHEASGIVESVGEGVQNVRVGDPVVVSLIRSCGKCYYCTRGDAYLCEGSFALDATSPLHTKDGQTIVHGLRTAAFAEYVVVHESQVITIPQNMSPQTASLLACGVITGCGAVVNTAQIEAGSHVAVIGTGGVGLNTVQAARIAGAKSIIALDLVDSKLETAKTFGATHTANVATDSAEDVVRKVTEGRGADYVFVTVGSARAIEQSMLLLRRGGTLVLVGMPASGVKLPIEAADFASNSQRILGSKMGSSRLPLDIPAWVGLYEQGRLKLDELITARYPLEDINQAIADVKAGSALRNVIVFE